MGAEGGEGERRGACPESQMSETPRTLRARCGRETGTTTGRDGVPANLIIVALAIAAATRAEVDRKQFARY